jgi:hypothetical protein
MAKEGQEGGGLFSDLVNLWKSVADLVRTVKKHTGGKGEADAAHAGPVAPLALPTPAAHFESAQLLTQHTPGWHRPNPATLAAPSYAPSMTAFGIVFIALGAVTKWPLSVIGALIFVLALAKWIGELLHD